MPVGSVGKVTETSFTVSWSSVVAALLWVFASSVVLLDLVMWRGSAAGHLGNLVGLVALAWTILSRMKRCQAANAASIARALARNEVIDGLARTGPQRIS